MSQPGPVPTARPGPNTSGCSPPASPPPPPPCSPPADPDPTTNAPTGANSPAARPPPRQPAPPTQKPNDTAAQQHHPRPMRRDVGRRPSAQGAPYRQAEARHAADDRGTRSEQLAVSTAHAVPARSGAASLVGDPRPRPRSRR